MKSKSNELFSLELSVGIFFGGLIATLICYLNGQHDLKYFIITALTFAFPMYLLKTSRTYERIKCDKTEFNRLLMFPEISKKGFGIYFQSICVYITVLVIFIASALFHNFVIQISPYTIITMYSYYAVLTSFIACCFFTMEIIFDFIIGIMLLGQIKSKPYNL
ncbi:hypothetical protein M4L38_08435 [Staphylococcus equorum]|uniref:hypothetical protein n=1 Tax=Staphylococcus equorum TaxID=246432 RepID=UPI002407CAF7|nr:hypothetical protein [Staphylococcus equorum]MDG0822758.1 hypothetical protein [Staphylococcus equorum]